jgi:hypothetical protein
MFKLLEIRYAHALGSKVNKNTKGKSLSSLDMHSGPLNAEKLSIQTKNRGIFSKNPGIFRVLDGPKRGGVSKPPKTHRIWSQREK